MRKRDCSTGTERTAYNYEWKVINKSGDNEVTVLGNEKHWPEI